MQRLLAFMLLHSTDVPTAPGGVTQCGGHNHPRLTLLPLAAAHAALGCVAQLGGHRRWRHAPLPLAAAQAPWRGSARRPSPLAAALDWSAHRLRWPRSAQWPSPLAPHTAAVLAAVHTALRHHWHSGQHCSRPVLPHSTEARVASLVLGCCALSPWQHRLPRRHRRSRTTLLHSAVVHATLGGLPWRSDPAACAHTAALGCGARRPATLPSIAALLLVPMLLPSAAVRAALGGVTPRGSPAACAHAAAPSCGARCPRRHHPAWRPCRSRPTLLHSAVRPLSCVVTRAIRSVGAPGTCGSPREARAASAPRVHCAVRPG